MNIPAILLTLSAAWHHDDSATGHALAAQRIDDACKSIRIAIATHTVEHFSGGGRLVTGEYFECNAEIPDDTHPRTDQQPEAPPKAHE